MPTILKIDKKRVIEVLLKHNLSIPVYQRAYSWTEQNVEALLSDINLRSMDGSEHFFGTLAFANEGKENILRVIDGQQRLSTTLLIYSVLLNYASNHKETKNKEQHDEKLRDLKKVNFTHELQETDLDANLKLILEENYSELTDNFKKNFTNIYNYCKSKNLLEIENNLDTLEKRFIVGMVFFTIDRKNEMLVFETLNARGIPLANFDLIRNHLISLCNDPGKVPPKEGVFARNLKLFNIHIYSKDLWKGNNLDVSAGKLESKLDEFFAEYAAYKKTALQIQTEISGQYRIFRNLKAVVDKMEITSIQQFQDLLVEMRSLLVLFIRLEKQKKFSDNVWLGVLGQKSAHYPLVFGLYKKFAEYDKDRKEWNNPEELQKYFKLMAFYVLKLLSVKGSGQSLQKLFLRVLGYAEKGLSISEIYSILSDNKKSSTYEIPSDQEFAKALMGRPTQTWIPRALAFVLGEIAYEKAGMKEPWHPENASLEHIMPQDPKRSEWPKIDTNSEDFKQCVNQIGNLTLIDSNRNSGMGNNAFEFKKKVYANSKSPLLRGDQLRLTPITQYKEFGYEQIKERTKILTKVILDYFNENLNA